MPSHRRHRGADGGATPPGTARAGARAARPALRANGQRPFVEDARRVMMPPPPRKLDESLDTLADECIAAWHTIQRVGSPQMRHLIDLLLFEVGVALAARGGAGKTGEPER